MGGPRASKMSRNSASRSVLQNVSGGEIGLSKIEVVDVSHGCREDLGNIGQSTALRAAATKRLAWEASCDNVDNKEGGLMAIANSVDVVRQRGVPG